MFEWVEVAEQLKLSLGERPAEMSEAWIGGTLSGTRRGAHVRIELEQKRVSTGHPHGGTSSTNTRPMRLADVRSWHEGRAKVIANYTLGHGPNFKLLRQGTFRTWLTSFGYQDIQVGNHALDYALTIKGDSPDLLKEVFLADADALVRYAKRRSGELPKSDGVTIEASIPLTTLESERDIKHLDELVDLLAGMTSVDIGGLGALRGLPGATVSNPAAELTTVSVECPSTVEFLPLWTGKGFRSSCRARVTRSIAKGRASCADASAVEALCGMPNLLGKLSKVASAQLAIDEEFVTLEWQEVVEDPEALTAAAELLALIAAPGSDGAYR